VLSVRNREGLYANVALIAPVKELTAAGVWGRTAFRRRRDGRLHMAMGIMAIMVQPFSCTVTFCVKTIDQITLIHGPTKTGVGQNYYHFASMP
jgi:hypothetical protein